MSISINSLIKRFDRIKSERRQWDDHFQECADYALPQKAIITETRTSGTKLKTDIYDSTAVDSVPITAAGLHSHMTNPSSKWFALKMKNKVLMENHDVKVWLRDSEDIIFDTLNDSNFNEVMPEWYVDFSVFGNNFLYEEEDLLGDIVNFYVRPISECYFLVNQKGQIDTMYRDFTFTARQAFQQWGENSGQKVMDLMKAQKVEERVRFLHMTLPRAERDIRKKDARNMPVASIYVEPDTKKILSEGGYHGFPWFTARFYKVSDSEYAYSPISQCLADVKMINQMSKTNIKAAQLNINPPKILPHDGYLLPFKMTPGANNFKLSSGAPDEKVEFIDIKRDIRTSLEMENQRRKRIEKALFVDLFLMLNSLPERTRTATEVIERVNERMLILGPALGRLMKTLSGIIIRTFEILNRNGKLPPVPEILIDEDYKIEFVSMLAKAQKASEMKSITDLLSILQVMSELDPSVVHNMNFDKSFKEIAKVTNAPANVLRSDDEVKEIREQIRQQQELDKALEQVKAGGEGAQAVLTAENMLKGGESGAGK